ncbi:TolC family protein [Cryomorphaceae bacterium 1068]|nr:TolC family protein [Cryomorphaceae bacterium 1068]
MRHRIALVWIFLYTGSGLFSQDTVSISNANVLAEIQESNLQVRLAQSDFESAQADYRQSNALFLPNISASYSAILTTNPLMAFGSKLNQEILTQSDFNPDLLNDPDQIDNYATMIEVQQPLINMDGLFERQAAKSKMDAYELKAQRTGEYLNLESQKAYMQLQIAYKAVEVLRKADATADANLKLVQDYYDQGLLQKMDLLDVEVRVNQVKNQLQMALSNLQNASDYLAFLLNQDMSGKVYQPTEDLNAEMESLESIAMVPEFRKDILAVEKSAEAYGKMLQSEKMGFLPRLNAFGNYQIYDGDPFGFGANGYLVGASLSWSLFDGYKSIGKYQKSKVEYAKAQTEAQQYRNQSQMELNQANRQLEDASNKLNNSRLAFEQAEEAYRIRSDRFKEGLMKTTDLLMSETQMFKKELEYLQAIFEFNYSKKYLEFLTR